jgi:hypothetical protein
MQNRIFLSLFQSKCLISQHQGLPLFSVPSFVGVQVGGRAGALPVGRLGRQVGPPVVGRGQVRRLRVGVPVRNRVLAVLGPMIRLKKIFSPKKNRRKICRF